MCPVFLKDGNSVSQAMTLFIKSFAKMKNKLKCQWSTCLKNLGQILAKSIYPPYNSAIWAILFGFAPHLKVK
jgi:hypothetical protein